MPWRGGGLGARVGAGLRRWRRRKPASPTHRFRRFVVARLGSMSFSRFEDALAYAHFTSDAVSADFRDWMSSTWESWSSPAIAWVRCDRHCNRQFETQSLCCRPVRAPCEIWKQHPNLRPRARPLAARYLGMDSRFLRSLGCDRTCDCLRRTDADQLPPQHRV